MTAVPRPPVQLITGEWRDVADLSARVAAAIRGGIRWVQLRAKTRSAAALYEAAVAVAPLVGEAGGLFVVNDRVDVALAAGAGGVHLPENGMRVALARRILGSGAWIAQSVHSLDAVRNAGGCDAVQFGPVYETASKRAFGAPRGIGELEQAAGALQGSRTSLIAVGGIDADRIGECRQAGADAVATIGAVWNAPDVELAARAFVAAASAPRIASGNPLV